LEERLAAKKMAHKGVGLNADKVREALEVAQKYLLDVKA